MTKELTELEAYKEVIDSSFHLQLNMNDAFHWACADAEDLISDDVPKIIPLVQKYGANATLLAYAAISRGYDSEHKKLLTPEYWEVKGKLETMANVGEILWEKWYDRKDKEVERQLFGGQEITWKPAPERIWKRRARWSKDKTAYVVQTARLPDGTWCIGTSIANTQERLVRKYYAKNNIPIKRCAFPNADCSKPCVRCGKIALWSNGMGGRTGKDLDCIWPQVLKEGEVMQEGIVAEPVFKKKKTWLQRILGAW